MLAALKFAQWRQQARPDQLPPDGEWRTAYLRGGRGSGKTWSGAHILAEWILSDPEPGEWGIVAPTHEDGWATCVEGPSGILAALGTTVSDIKQRKSPLVAWWNRSMGELRFRNGHLLRVASADDGGLRIQGKNLKGAWADEIGLWDKWQTAWTESLGYAVRIGRSQIIVTGTPKASRKAKQLVRQLLDDPTIPVRRLRTVDNADNLSAGFLADVVGRAKGTRLERQELEGELIEDVEGALWTADLIDADRITVAQLPDLSRVVVAVDPAVTASEHSDETGIIVVGECDGHGYVLADYSMVGTPNACMERVVRAYHDHRADCVVGEVNNGGDYIGSLLRTVDTNIPYHKVHATRGKALRAEPASALYEQHRVHHVGTLTELEDQMCLVAGTLVETLRGQLPIEDVRPGDWALTREGWAPVEWAGMTGVATSLVSVTHAMGSVYSTACHPIYLPQGRAFADARSVRPGQLLAVSPNWAATAGRLHGAGAGITEWAQATIGMPEGHCCTVQSGSPTTAISLTAFSSTTSTMTRVTTESGTWPSRHPRSTPLSTPGVASPPWHSKTDAVTEPSSGGAGRARISPAGSAVPRSAPGTCGRPSVRTSAVESTGTVVSANGTGVPVFNLKIADGYLPEFFANGILVHNCTWAPDSPGSPDRLDALVWGIAEMKSLTAGDWMAAYGVVTCAGCTHQYLGEIHERCPKCHLERETD